MGAAARRRGGMANSKDVHLSKALSWLLRHGAVKEGLKLSPEGYLPVQTILQNKSFRNNTEADIRRVVTNNEKQRFTLRVNPDSNVLEIKANQGHSVDISDCELIPILEPKYQTVIHGTYLTCWPQIKANGLSRMKRQHIHLAKGTPDQKHVISGLRQSAEIHIYIDLGKALLDGLKFFESSNGVILTRGDERGYLPTKYFLKAVNIRTAMEAAGPTQDPPGAPVVTKVDAPQKTPVVTKVEAPANTPVVAKVEATAKTPAVAKAEAAAETPVVAKVEAAAKTPVVAKAEAPAKTPLVAKVEAPAKAPAAHSRNRHRRRGAATHSPAISGEPDACKVHVSGFPPYTQSVDLRHTFEAIGPATVDRLTDRTACLVFKSRQHAEAAIAQHNKLIVYGSFLAVRPYAARPGQDSPNRTQKFVRSKEKEVIISPEALDLSGDFCSQLDALLQAVRLTSVEAGALGVLYQDVEDALQPHMPGCIALPFGSITTGLGIKTSDADCFVMVPGAADYANSALLVNKAKKILQARPQKFAEILSIPRANTPIVKFFHVPTGTNCDLSFKTPLGAQNSRLIAFLLRADPRLIPVAVAIKYWAKVHELSGTGKMTNYALTMLVIFYLQQIGMLPPVVALQHDRKYDCIVDSWNTGFDDTPLPPSTNPISISELIGGFYTYYSNFNFNDLVVCPYLGVPIKKELFKDLNTLPSQFDIYKQNVLNELVMPMRITTTMCVQDPFEQSHNVASSIAQKKAEDIKAYIKLAADAYEKEKSNQCKNFLKIILLQKPNIVKARLHPEYKVHFSAKMLSAIVSPDRAAVVKEIVFVIFERLLKMKLTKSPVIRLPGYDLPKNEKDRYTATITRAIWKRKQLSKLYSLMKMDFERKQEMITEEILRVEKNVINLTVQVSLSYTQRQNFSVFIKLQDGDTETFREFGKFFNTIMQQWFVTLLQPYTRHPEREIEIRTLETSADSNCVPNDIIFESLGSEDSLLSEARCTNGEVLKQEDVAKNDTAVTGKLISQNDVHTEEKLVITNSVSQKDIAAASDVVMNDSLLALNAEDTDQKGGMVNEVVAENVVVVGKDVVINECVASDENLKMKTDIASEKDVVINENVVTQNDVDSELVKDVAHVNENAVAQNDSDNELVTMKGVVAEKDVAMTKDPTIANEIGFAKSAVFSDQ